MFKFGTQNLCSDTSKTLIVLANLSEGWGKSVSVVECVVFRGEKQGGGGVPRICPS